jgi:UDP-GlcNAc:undecaprenyl-phosphate/decaprenyl-phosphate GlcNAc-1-phosphate transferase
MGMISVVGISLFAILIVSYLVCRVVIMVCFKFDILDRPNERSSHVVPRALMGGIGIIVAWLIGLVLLGYFFDFDIVRFWQYGTLIFIAVLIGGLGLVDDLTTLSSRVRFPLHILLSFISSALVFSLSGEALGLINVVLIVLGTFWIVGLINVYNFMDGIDGIAAGSGAVFAAGFALIGFTMHLTPVFVASIALIPACAGFLGLNFPPAKLFMGDVGATFLGYIFAVLGLLISMNDTLNILYAVVILLPFLADSGFTIFKRLFRGEDIFEAHREHLYQQLVINGWSHLRVSVVYWGAGVVIIILLAFYY